MVKRRGVSLVNVMVFMVFAVMLTAQVFFFAKNAVDEAADEREMMMYRMNLDSLVQEAEEELKKTGIGEITHDSALETKTIDYTNFYEETKKGAEPITVTTGDITYRLMIHDLSYNYSNAASFSRSKWQEQSGENMYKKVFAAMPFIPKKEVKKDEHGNPVKDDAGNLVYEDTDEADYRYYLIRAWVQLPENFYGRKLMYQVLVRRDNEDDETGTKLHKVETLSFQEVWF